LPVSLSKKLINYSDLAIAVVAYIFYKIMITSQLGLLSLFLTISFTVVAGGILSYIGLLGGGFCPGGFCPGGFCPGGLCPGGFCPVTVFPTQPLFDAPAQGVPVRISG